jgi:predicted acetyltransferase
MTDTVICRRAEEADTGQIKALWSTCFDDTPAFVDWYFNRYYRHEHTLGIFDNKNLLASAQVIPYAIQLRGRKLDCGYVVGVDTAPEARNRGYARRLLSACLELERQRQHAISLLMPFEGQFYYRYGYPFCYFHQQIKIYPKELRCAAKPWGVVNETDAFTVIDELQRIYEQYTAAYDGFVVRSRESWQLLLEDGALDQTRCYLIEQDGRAEGYCFWTELEDAILIREMAWCSEEARTGLLHFLMETAPETRKLWLELPNDDVLAGQLAVSKTAVVQYPFLMARIADVKLCLEALCYPAEARASFRMQVSDAFAPWNHAVFEVTIADGQAVVQKLEYADGGSGEGADIAITIEGLSQLVMGARSAQKLHRQKELVCEPEYLAVLQQLWPEQSLYFNEYY